MGKAILITGASSGLGLSHAVYLTSRGYSVVGTSRYAEKQDPATLKETYLRDHTKFGYTDKTKTQVKARSEAGRLAPKNIRENLDAYLEQIKYVSMDVTNSNSVTRAMDSIGPIDVLINNAGSGYFGPVEEISLEKAQSQFDTNFFGYLRVIQAVLPEMRERKAGRIINTASLGGIYCIPFQAHYSGTKAAIIRMSESLRLELKPFNIRVSCLSPGDINTSFDVNTVLLTNPEKQLQSTNILEMLEAMPVPKTSPYYDRATIPWRTIVQNLLISPPPIVVSRRVEKIIKAKRPKAHYSAGSRLQTFGANFIMDRLLPNNWALWIMAKFYGL
ncbi:MAG: SDR family oxidoreductase [Candidatus Hodarchaeota archaeon]